MFDNLVCLTTTLPTTKLVNSLPPILLVLNPDRMVQKFEEVIFMNQSLWIIDFRIQLLKKIYGENPSKDISMQPSEWT